MGKAKQVLDKEQEFHDNWAETIRPEEVAVDDVFEACTSPEPRWLLDQMGDIKGKCLLDLGCGAGEAAVYFAKQGADVTAADLSPGMLEVVQRVAQLHGTSLTTQVVTADNLQVFDSDSFDIVYAGNLLHHVDKEQCIDEVYRILKPGGCAALWDPVDYNPVINVYRKMAADVRTDDEKPIRKPDVDYIEARFGTVKKRFFWLTTLMVFLKFYFIDRVHPSEDRYWKRILTKADELEGMMAFWTRVDNFLLKLVPALGWWCWNIGVVAYKEPQL